MFNEDLDLLVNLLDTKDVDLFVDNRNKDEV